jgi:hypothetical protein
MHWMHTKELPSWTQAILISKRVCSSCGLVPLMEVRHPPLPRTFIRKRIKQLDLSDLLVLRGLAKLSSLQLPTGPRLMQALKELVKVGPETFLASTPHPSPITHMKAVSNPSAMRVNPRLNRSQSDPILSSPAGVHLHDEASHRDPLVTSSHRLLRNPKGLLILRRDELPIQTMLGLLPQQLCRP